MDDRVGTTLSHYRIKGKLGRGGMGEVYLAEDTKLNRDVALKVLPPDVASDPERLARFEREAKAVAGLNHPNIVTLHSIEEAEGVRFITMERVSGQTLSTLVPETGLKLARFFKLAIALADALSTAHAQGITHRDLKPENVMVDDDGRLKILDFGLAKLAPTAADSSEESDLKTASVTQDGRILGTVSYMSPEQAQGKAIDHRSDIFSLGILLYEMATGVRPFKGDNNMSVLSGILKDEPTPVTEVNAELPRPLARMIQRTLEKDVKNRYQSTSDLRKDLEDLQRDVETGEISATGLSSPDFSPAGARPAWLWPAAIAGSALLACALWLTRATSAPTPVEVAAIQDGRPSLAIFYFDNLTGDPSLDWLRTGLTDMLVTDLTQSPDLRVLGTTRLYQILEEMGRLDGQTTSFEVVQAVAQKARVTNALVGSFVKAGETIRISARLQDATSGEVIASERVEGQGEDSILSLVDALTQRIRSRYDIGGPVSMNLDRDLKDVTTSSLKAYKAYVEGVRLHEELREQEAIPHLEQAVELDPEFAMAWAKLSVSSGNLGRKEKAREYAKRALDLIDHLSPRERYYIEGRYYSLDPREGERAIAAYEKAVEEYDHTSARNNLAQAYIELQRYPEAIEHLEQLRDRGMTFPGTYSALSQAYVATGDFEKSYEVLKEFTEANRTMAAGWHNLAKLLIAWGRYDDAREAVATGEELDSESGNADAQRWQIAVLEDDWATAEKVAGQLADAEHPSMRFLMYAGQAIREGYRGQAKAALRSIRSARDDASLPAWTLPQTAFIESNILIQAGDYAGAVAAARSVAELTEDPFNRGYARHIEALALALEGRYEEADAAHAEFEAYIGTLPPRSMGAQLPAGRGLFQLARGHVEKAAASLAEAHAQLPKGEVETNGTAVDIWYYLGRIEFERGNPEAARAWFGRVTGAGHRRLYQPFEYVRSLDYLGRIAEARGDDASAARYYGRYLEFWSEGDLDRDRVAAAKDWLASHSPSTSAR